MKKEYKFQIMLILFGFILLYAMVIGRLYQLQILKHYDYEYDLKSITIKTDTMTPLRGDIVDRNNQVLATSQHLSSIYINAYYFKRTEKELKSKKKLPEIKVDEIIERFSYVLNEPVDSIRAKFKRSYELEEKYIQAKEKDPNAKVQRGTLSLKRLISHEQEADIKNIIKEKELPGRCIWFIREEKRIYPRGDLASTVIGVTKFDAYGEGSGNLGLEQKFDKELKGSLKTNEVIKTGASLGIDNMIDDDLFSYVGNRLVLTIDVNIQELTENALRNNLARSKGDFGIALVQKTKTGEILAMASLPSFNPAQYGEVAYPEYCIKNNCVQYSIEPGSVAKVFTFATLFNEGLLTKDEPVNCYGGRKYFGSRLVKDADGDRFGVIPAADVFYHSSNVGTDEAAQKIKVEDFRAYLQRYGVGQLTGVDLPGEEMGIFHSTWSGYTMTSLPMGYEMALTPIQVITAVSAILNNGTMMKPYLVKEIRKHNGDLIKAFEPQISKQNVIKPSTSALMRELMEGVVLKGTGKHLVIPGFRLGGKTGTTRKSDKKGKEYIASFIGALPINDPEITVYCWIDNPKGKFYAAEVAVPIAREIFEGVIRVLGMQPTEPIVPTTRIVQEDEDGNSIEIVSAETSGQQLQNDQNANTAQPPAAIASAVTPTPAAPAELIPDPNAVMVPDLQGLAMKDVKNVLLEKSILNFKFYGSGIVIDQKPAAGTPLKQNEKLEITFAPRNQG